MSNINRANGTPPLMQYDALCTIALRNVIIVKYPYHHTYTCCIVKI